MANADFTIRGDTKLDSSGFQLGLSKLSSLATSGMKYAALAVGAVSTALVAAGGHAVKVGSDFEAGMSEVSAISGAVGEDLAALTDKAKEMGAKTKFSATESAEALKYMAMAGWDTKSMLDGLPGVMNLAAASGEDLSTVSDIVTDAMTAFGLSADKSAHFADVLAKAASSSNTNVGMMGATFKYVAPLAGSMGYSIEDSALAIGLMANAGIKGEQAGTALRSTLTRLVKPPKDAAAALSALGVSAQNSDGSMKPLRETMTQLREKFAGLTDAEKASYAASIAGQEGMSGFLAIVNASDEDFNKLAASIDHADGAAQKMADTMQDNLQGQVTILKSSLEGLGIEIYDSMQEPLKNAAKEGIDYVNRLTEAFKTGGLQGAVEEAGGIFAELAAKAAEAAPGMVDAAVGFIQSFVSGIKENRNQILEAAKNIVFALVDGLVSLLPGEIQKPVKETVETLKKSFNDGGLKTAIQTVGNILHNLGKVVTNIAKVILPPLSKAVDFLGYNFKIIVPLLGAGVAAIKAYKIAQSATKWFEGLSKAVADASAATAGESLAAMASVGALTLKQAAVKVLNGEIGLATAAQLLWNSAMAANPVGLITVAVVGLGAAISGLLIAMNSEQETTDEVIEKSRQRREEMDEVNQKYQDAKKAAEEAAETNLVQIANTQNLAKELMNLADSSGKVKDADKGRAQFILNELNNALGTEYTMTGNQIEQYKELKESVWKTIDAKKAEILLQAHEEEYRTAIQARAEAEQKQAESYVALSKNEQEISRLTTQMKAADAEFQKGVEDGLSTFELQKIAERRDGYAEEIRIAEERTAGLQSEYLANKADYETYLNDINNYETAYAEMLQGNTDKAVELLDKQGQGFVTAKDVATKSAEEQKQILSEQYETSLAKLKLYEINYKNGVEGYTEAGLEILRQAAEDAKAEAEKMGVSTVDGYVGAVGSEKSRQRASDAVSGMVAAGVAAARVALKINSPSKVFRDKIGKAVPEGMAIGIEQGGVLVDSASKEMAENAILQAKAGIAAFQNQMAMERSGSVQTTYLNQQQNSATQNIQNIYFEQPMQAPDEIARAIRIQQTYGLAGARG